MKTATPALARAINDRLALDLLLEHGPLSAPQLRTLTGLSRPTVADLIERLSAGGLVRPCGETGEEKRGPNARLYRLVGEQAHVAGVDIRRSGTFVTVADLAGTVVGRAERPASADLVRSIREAVTEAARGRSLHAAVLGAPGMVHPHTGRSDGACDMGVSGWDPQVPDRVQELLGVERLVLENEVNLAAVAEHRAGAARGREDFVLLWLDEGVGGAVVLGGRVRRGVSGGAGEVGHLELDGDNLCCALTPAVRPGGPGFDRYARQVARGAAAMVAVLDPGLVVLGGAAGRTGGADLADAVSAHLSGLVPVPTEVHATAVDGNPVLQGAVLTALDLARDAVFG
ncbi:putative NBD/HSP70 family sugar kinase [Streptacidiphilus sp. MAP12-33]|uniref:ROK family protein n=1 Tax=Streptacidiphilus sp. MAP12-33 TaxID=3156266 RepID=UPI00351602BB